MLSSSNWNVLVTHSELIGVIEVIFSENIKYSLQINKLII